MTMHVKSVAKAYASKSVAHISKPFVRAPVLSICYLPECTCSDVPFKQFKTLQTESFFRLKIATQDFRYQVGLKSMGVIVSVLLFHKDIHIQY